MGDTAVKELHGEISSNAHTTASDICRFILPLLDVVAKGVAFFIGLLQLFYRTHSTLALVVTLHTQAVVNG